MKPYYYCLSVQVNNYLWLFQNKALEITGEAIEEVENGFLIRTEESLEPIKTKLSVYAKELEAIFGEAVALEFHTETCKNEDWIIKYRNSITPIECGEYYIYPSWYAPKANKINIIIDPALAFGSGHHASTFGCLKAFGTLAQRFQNAKGIVNNTESLKDKKVLDVGCGSGILAICAKKQGAFVWACDTDENAIESTKDNARKNDVVLEHIFLGSLNGMTEAKGVFDIVLANILADIIVVLPLQDFVKKGGYLILSGILEAYVSRVLDKFKEFEVVSKEVHTEWATLVLKNKGY